MLETVALLGTFIIAMIAAGHGVAPMGLLFLVPPVGALLLTLWASTIVLIVGTLLYRQKPKMLAGIHIAGALGLYLTWFSCVWAAWSGRELWAALPHNLLLSLPFQLTFLAVITSPFRQIIQ